MALRKPDAYLWKPSAIMNSRRVEKLSALEELWYRRALDRAFDDNGISADPAEAAIRIGRKCTSTAAEKILRIFFKPKPRDPSMMVNGVQEIERKNAIKALKKFSDAGKESGRKRREKKQLNAERRSNDVATINKEINKEKKEEEKEETPIPRGAFAWPLKPLVDAFPEYLAGRVTPAMIGFIESEVKTGDEAAWNSTVRDYQMNFNPATNRYLPDKTANVLSVFRKYKAEIERGKNGTGKQQQSNTGRRRSESDSQSTDEYLDSIGAKPAR